MEENKKTEKKEVVKRSPKKLSYEELENAARQISAQLDAVMKENNQLKNAVNQLQMNNLYTELNFRFKVIEFQDSFSPSFVDNCINVIEDIMTTKESEDTTQDDNEE